MLPVLTPAQAAALDAESRDRGVPVETLMENAGRAVARAAGSLAGGHYGRRAVVVCGKGNNGGDGLVAARYLVRWGLGATAVLLVAPESLREPVATMLRLAHEAGVAIRPFSDRALRRELARADVAVDAIFGTGFRGAPEAEHAEAIAAVNDGAVPVVAVDIPSGVDGETGAAAGPAVRAHVTVTFGAPKTGLLLQPGHGLAGQVEVADIGFPAGLVRGDAHVVEDDDVAAMLPRRAADSHKRSSGVVLVVGGSRRMTGAVRLMVRGAQRLGAGLVTVAVPEGIVSIVQAAVVEATFVPLPETAEGTVAAAAIDVLMEAMASVDAVAAGPGMTREAETSDLLRELVHHSPVPFVLDADGLNAFAEHREELAGIEGDAVLTPHAGEFGRLLGMPYAEAMRDPLGNVRKLAAECGAAVVLKGSPTIVGEPGGEVRFVVSGSPALATGGTGDVLTGAVAALLGRGLAPVEAASAAAHVHGLAGALAGRDLGEGATATDVADRLPSAVRGLTT